MRNSLSTSHFGPESLEDAAVDYIIRNLDLYDVQTSVNVRQSPFLMWRVHNLLYLFIYKYNIYDKIMKGANSSPDTPASALFYKLKNNLGLPFLTKETEFLQKKLCECWALNDLLNFAE